MMRRSAFFTKVLSPLTWSFLAMIVAACVGATVLYTTQRVQEPQQLSSRASSSTSTITISFKPDKTTLNHDQTLFIDVLINTGGESISGVSLTGVLEGVIADLTRSNTSHEGLVTAYSTQSQQGNQFQWKTIIFATANNESLFSTHGQSVKLATLVVNPSAKGTIVASINQGNSTVVGQSSNTAISYPGALTITVNDPATSSNPPDAGIHRGCNEYCADSNECASQFTCYYNRCRNPRNIDNQQCQLPPSPSPVSTVGRGGTTASKGTTNALPSPTIVNITSSPVPSLTSIIVDGIGSTRSAQRPSPTPSPSASPSPTPLPSLEPSPSPTTQPEPEKKGTNIFLIALLITLLVGGVAGLAYVLIKYRG